MFTLKNSTPYLILFLLIFSASCNKKKNDPVAYTGDYIKISNSDADARSNATGFTIGNKGYITTGISGLGKLNDLWEFDPELNSWTQKVVIPGPARYDAASFAINGKGYVGTGWDGITYFKDFYEYDVALDKWTPIADFPVSGRQGSISFSLNNAGYVGTGYDGKSYLKDFYKFENGSWSPIVSLPGEKRIDGVAFTINGKAYVGLGTNNGSYVNDLNEFDPATNKWEELKDAAPYADVDKNGVYDRDFRRAGASAFTINNKGYVATGNYNGYNNTTWEFNPDNRTWVQKSNFEGSGRTDAVGLSINGMGFIVGGKNGAAKYDDVWQFFPDNTQQ